MNPFDDEDTTYVAFTDLALALIAVLLVLVALVKVKTEGIRVEAEYLITIDWDAHVDADVDLWASPPPGKQIPVYFRNKEGGNLFLDRDSRGFTDDRIKGPDGSYVFLPHKEVITVRGKFPETITFAIHLYNYMHNGNSIGSEKGLNLEVHYEITKINPKIKVIAQGSKILNSIGDSANFATLEIDASGEGKLIDSPLKPIPDMVFAHGTNVDANDDHGDPAEQPSVPTTPYHYPD